MKWLALFIAILAVYIIGVQVWAHVQSRRMRGKPAPVLEGFSAHAMPPGRPVLIYFHAPGCRACRSMTPLMLELQKERDDVFVLNAAVERESALAFGVMATPSTVRVADGRITDVILGPRTREELLQLLRDQ